MKRLVIIGGGLQVLLTVAVGTAVPIFFGRTVSQAVFFGFLLAMSSTAIVLKTYADRNEIDSPHGKTAVAILVFQDISVVLMMLMIPLLGGDGSVAIASVALQLGGSLLALLLIVGAAYVIIPRFLKLIVPLRSPEVFLLTGVLFCLGLSWITSQFGLSLALGAFIAGVVLADTDYSHQITADILPFRDIFNAIFFVSIGMLLSLGALWSDLGTVVFLVVALIAAKALIVWGIVRLLGYPQRIAAIAGLGLAQIGEFSFVLAKLGRSADLLPDADYQRFLAASIISMIATPFLIAYAPAIGISLQRFLKDGDIGDAENSEADIHLTSSGGLRQHVIIVGYGLNGRNLARVLRSVGVPYVILEANAETVRRSKAKGEKINFGDATRREVLIHAGIEEAWAIVLAMSDPQAARRTVDQARALNERVHIIVRTRYVAEITELFELGANEVIPEEFETSIEIFWRVLNRYGFPRNVIESQVEMIRRQGYEMLRSASLPEIAEQQKGRSFAGAATESVRLGASSPVIGKSLGELNLREKTGATVIAVLRGGETFISPRADIALEEGDTAVLIGPSEKISEAVNVLQPGANLGGFNP